MGAPEPTKQCSMGPRPTYQGKLSPVTCPIALYPAVPHTDGREATTREIWEPSDLFNGLRLLRALFSDSDR